MSTAGTGFEPFFQFLLAIVMMVLTGMASIYVPRAIAAFETATGVKVSDQQRAAIMGAVTTAAGILQTELDQGKIRIADIHEASSAVNLQAVAALARVPESAAAQGVTAATAAAMIVARVDTSPKPLLPVTQPAVQ